MIAFNLSYIRKSLYRMVVSDFWRKVLALFLACLLYYYGTTQTHEELAPERISGVAVELKLPPGAINTAGGVPPVTLRVTGRAEQLKMLSSRSFSGEIQVRSFVSNQPYIHQLTPMDFKGPDGVTISGVEPQELVLNLEKVITRRVPIEVQFDALDRLPEDYRVERVSCSPDEAQITGPESVVNELRMISTMPIPLDDSVTNGFDYMVQLRKPEGLNISPLRIATRVEIIRKYISKNYKGLALRILLTPEQRDKFTAEVSIVPELEVEISGPENILTKLSSKNLSPYIDLSAIESDGIATVETGCIISGIDSSELKIKRIKPEKIEVKVTKTVKNSK